MKAAWDSHVSGLGIRENDIRMVRVWCWVMTASLTLFVVGRKIGA